MSAGTECQLFITFEGRSSMSPLSAIELDMVSGGVSMSADGKSCTDNQVAAVTTGISKAAVDIK